MNDLYRHFGRRRLWEKHYDDKPPTVNVTEIWRRNESESSVAVESKAVPFMTFENWLDEPADKNIVTAAHTRILRLVWVGQDQATSRHGPPPKQLERLLDIWKLQDGYDYALSCAAGVSALPHKKTQQARIFTATYHPKLAMTWSHSVTDSGVPNTHVIVFAERQEREELLHALQSRWTPSLIDHPMFPAFLCTLMLSQELDTTLEDIKTVVRNVEARTGHHRFTTRRQTRPAAGELGSLSAEMSGCAAKLANGTRKLKVVEALHAFILQHADLNVVTVSQEPTPLTKSQRTSSSYYDTIIGNTGEKTPTSLSSDDDPGCTTASTLLTQQHLPLLAHRAEMQAVDVAYVQQRVQVQIAALFHLIAQQDNAIAFETASATRSIAKDSLQDSSSMKMLALVAMFFLPGSFVAALFSAPLFVWPDSTDGGSPSSSGGISLATKPQFKLFWAVAVPLTVATFGLYAVWIVAQKRRMKRRLKIGEA